MSIEAVKEENEERLMRLPNVTGVGIGEKGGNPIIKVFVTHKVPESDLRPEDVVPKALGDWETDVEPIGIIRAQTLK